MRIFIDSSVALAACGSSICASREVFRLADANRWLRIATPYVVEEVLLNLPSLSPSASGAWAHLRTQLLLMDDVVTLDRPAIFEPAKDRPILFSALPWADVLLTLDRADFGGLLDQRFYDLLICRPGAFLEQERAASRLKESHE